MEASLSKVGLSGSVLETARSLPSGARFYRCALQVNPYSYLEEHAKHTIFKDEVSYNSAIIEACKEHGIEVIAVTDHYRVDGSEGLAQAARDAGIYVFSGFEAVSKDGVHYLCLFDLKTRDELVGILGACGIHGAITGSPVGDKDSLELIECIRNHGGICIAAHVTADQGGLLAVLKGQPRVNVWTSRELLACSIPASVDAVQQGYRGILLNQDAQHKRSRPIAILNAQDVSAPADFEKQGGSCWIKMSSISVEGLRQAFLDPESRIRLASDEVNSPHAEFLAMAWEGGFLDGTKIHFNENLNVLVGGRGTGKSTIVESVRAVLGIEPKGEEAAKSHTGMVKNVLKNGTTISLLVRSNRPTPSEYVIERILPNSPVVKDKNGNVLPLQPLDILPHVDVFGQHEISELARSPEKRTSLLSRFEDKDPEREKKQQELRTKLKRSRSRLLEARENISSINERLAALPSLEETLKRFQEAGLEEKMKEKTLLIREEAIFKNAQDKVTAFQAHEDELRKAIPVSTDFVSETALTNLPGKETLSSLLTVLEAFNSDLSGVANNLDSAISKANLGIEAVRHQWDERKKGVDAEYAKILRELQQESDIDAEEFVSLKEQIEELRPLSESKAALEHELNELERERLNLVNEWESLKAENFRAIAKAAKRVTRALPGRVKVEVINAGSREPLFDLLKEKVGQMTPVFDRLRGLEELSLVDFAHTCTLGKEELKAKYAITPAAAEKIAQAAPELSLMIQELELPATTTLFLNVAAEGQEPVWKSLEALSTGQKATAILLLLLLEADAPLIVDQPEDDLDNRFITDGVVPIMRREKRRRQFIFSTHNANIPVLGDAELILGLTADGEDCGQILPTYMGSLDSRSIQELVEEILEGGKAAFEMRREKYGF